jgi:WD40 repeat protein
MKLEHGRSYALGSAVFHICVAFLLFDVTISSTNAQSARSEIVPQLGHSDIIRSVSYSRDGRLIVTASDDGSAVLWDAATGFELRQFKGHDDAVTSASFSPDGQMILTSGRDHTARLWDVMTGSELRRLNGHIDGVTSAAFSPDGRQIITGGGDNLGSGGNVNGMKMFDSPRGDGDNVARLWDVATGHQLLVFKGHQNLITSVSFSHDGRSVLTGSADGTARLWDAATGQPVRVFGDGHGLVWSVAFSPDGRSMVTAADDGSSVWEVATGKLLRSFEPATSAVFAPDGRTLLTGSIPADTKAGRETHATLQDTVTGAEIRRFGSPFESMFVAFSPDGKNVATAGPRTLGLWDAETGKQSRQLSAQTWEFATAVYSSDGQRILTGHNDGSARLWEAETGKELREYLGHTNIVRSVAFSPDGLTILTGSFDKTARLWDRATARQLLSFDGHSSAVFSVNFSPDGKSVLTGAVDSARLWSVSTGHELRRFKQAGHNLDSVTMSVDGRLVFAGGAMSTAGGVDVLGSTWEIGTGKQIRQSKHDGGTDGNVFSPNGKNILTADSKNGAFLWNIETGRELQRFGGLADAVTHVAFSPDGRRVLAAGGSTIKMWDVVTGQSLVELRLDNESVESLAFSPDGRMVLIGGSRGASVWNAATGERLASLFSFGDSEWLTITPEGFFDASANGAKGLIVVRGRDPYTIDQFYDSLHRPDLVQQKLASDPNGLVKAATAKLDLDKTASSGRAPGVMIASPETTTSGAQVVIEATVTDQGGGIGRIEWRNNRKTIDVGASGGSATPAGGRTVTVRKRVPLVAGDNVIEIKAYNAANLIESEPVQVTVNHPDPERTGRSLPQMYVLALGINDYQQSRLHLNFAIPDAKAVVDGLQRASGKLYERVNVTTVLDAGVNAANLDRVFADLKGKVRAQDVFVFYLSGHGAHEDGKFYFIPQDFKGGEESVLQQAISQDKLKGWFAQISAHRSILLFDACHSGSLTDIVTRRFVEKTILDHLVRDTGATVVTATTDDKPAAEGYRGHGVFTYALLSAFADADSNGDGLIDVKEFADYIAAQVPVLTEAAWGIRQVPQVNVVGSIYPLLSKTSVLPATDGRLP